jgi:hypothetical protein
MESKLLLAVRHGDLLRVRRVLRKCSASIQERDGKGRTALLVGARWSKFSIVKWLLEYGWSSLDEVDSLGCSAWDYLQRCFCPLRDVRDAESEKVTNLLRAMLLRGDAPASLMDLLQPWCKKLAQEGARLRARLPAYLVQRRALLDVHCPMLLPPLVALVSGYEEPSTTEELWATGLGVAP